VVYRYASYALLIKLVNPYSYCRKPGLFLMYFTVPCGNAPMAYVHRQLYHSVQLWWIWRIWPIDQEQREPTGLEACSTPTDPWYTGCTLFSTDGSCQSVYFRARRVGTSTGVERERGLLPFGVPVTNYTVWYSLWITGHWSINTPSRSG